MSNVVIKILLPPKFGKFKLKLLSLLRFQYKWYYIIKHLYKYKTFHFVMGNVIIKF